MWWRNTGLGSFKPLVNAFSSTNHYSNVYYVCFFFLNKTKEIYFKKRFLKISFCLLSTLKIDNLFSVHPMNFLFFFHFYFIVDYS